MSSVPHSSHLLGVSLAAGDQARAGESSTWKTQVIAISFLSSAAMLMAQQASFRLLAPLIGSSIETWSTIIGVFLTGIAAGNWLAARFADRHSPARLLAIGLLAGAVLTCLMPWLAASLGSSASFVSLPLWIQIFVAATVVCLLPATLMAFVTPPAVRSLVNQPGQTGSAAGQVFAWGTLGSLFGNYLTGFFLMPQMGVQSLIVLATGMLLACALLTFRAPSLSRDSSGQAVHANSSSKSDLSVLNGTQEQYFEGWLPILVVVIGSFVSGAVEGAAFRILAPLTGVSMYLAAGVVGVVLAGMSLGNFYGGRLASRHGNFTALIVSLLGGAAATLMIAPLWRMGMNVPALQELSMIPKVIVWSFGLFFLPAFALGTVSPQVIRLAIRDINVAGRTTGQLYAWSTLGCIGGILASGWLMIEWIGAIRSTIFCGLLLVAAIAALLRFARRSGDVDRSAKRLGFLNSSLLMFAVMMGVVCQSPYDRETRYFSIRVRDEVCEGRELKMMLLDRLVHSGIDPADPTYLHYPHEQVQGEIIRSLANASESGNEPVRILIIGGGGYSLPRWIEAQPDLGEVVIDVVEIDPGVTEVAHDLLALPRNTRINSIHMDGRQFIKGLSAGTYDLIIQDAVNDLSVPYHLMTAEYNALIRKALRPNGAYMLTVIDSLKTGRFMSSAIRTMQTTFDDIRLMAPQCTSQLTVRNVFVIGGRPESSESHVELQQDWWSSRTTAHLYPQSVVEEVLERNLHLSPVLTDDYAPVDSLMAANLMDSGAK